MKILGLNIGELSTAALMIDGEIIAACSEERFSRKKNDEQYPEQAIEYCLEEAGINGSDLDIVAIAGTQLAFGSWIARVCSTFSIQDHIRAQKEYWYPKLYENKNISWTEVFKDKLDLDQFPGSLEDLIRKEDTYYSEGIWPAFKEKLHKGISDSLGVELSKIIHVDHHACHAAYAYWGSPFRDKPVLTLTADAFGDDLSATVNIAENNKIKRIHSVAHTDFRLARLYRYVTLILGMKPNEHEYKVMGLAPYAKPEILQGSYEIFKNTMYVNGLDFAYHEKPPDMYFYFKDKLEGYRFDGIAGGLQKYLEEILTQWILNAIKHTNIHDIVFSGGIAMNVKAHKVIHELPEVNDLFVCGSGSDESLALGVCYQVMSDHCNKKGISNKCIRPLNSMYLGKEYSTSEIKEWINNKKLFEEYEIEYDVSSDVIADYLTQGYVIGRCAGRMEFGQRALGNRSIMADPRDFEMVEKINKKIKNRDFWMPFTPSILAEHSSKYLVNPKKIQAPFMTIAFDSTDTARKDLAATKHPADHTLRPQCVDIKTNPKYHEIISAFYKKTGVAGILNTSFNLHGEPIVQSTDDALHVFKNSEIDMILLENILIKK